MCLKRIISQEDSEIFEEPTLRTAFDVLDADGDGKIGYEDLQSFYGGFSAEEEVIGSMISAADLNKDGYVEYEEFEKVLHNGGSGGGGENKEAKWLMADAFRVMDKDGDGKVGLQDLTSYLKWVGLETKDEDVRAMIKLACGDEHQGVTLDSFIKILDL